ncbi:MATE family efflux transporter [Sebaldella termitidis]|uniref:MATE family efflux transporter n=1 Tax=Sebaldella termitidis TaxID=826 RepID=UPI003EBE6A1E
MRRKQSELETESVGKLLRKYTIPALIGNIVIVVYNFVDRWFIGQFIGEEALAASGITFYLLMVFIAFSMLIGIGAGTIISIRLGQRNIEDSEKILGNSVTLFFVVSIILTVILWFNLDFILLKSGANSETLPYARAYMRILIPISLANFYSYGLSNVMRAANAPKTAMFAMIIGGVVNLVLDYIFVVLFHMGIEGTAYATLIGNVLSAVYVMYFFIRGKPLFRLNMFGRSIDEASILRLRKKHLPLSYKISYDILKIGMSSFLLQSVNAAVGVVINNVISSTGGTTGVAIMTIINTYLTLIVMSVYSIAQGAQPIIGYNYGAKRFDRVKASFNMSIIWGLIMSAVFFLVIMLIPRELILLFNKDSNSNVIHDGIKAMRIYFMLIIPASVGTIVPNYFQSIGNAREAIILNIMRQVFIFMIVMLIFTRIWGLDGVWYAQPVTDVIFTFIVGVLLVIENKKLSKEIMK